MRPTTVGTNPTKSEDPEENRLSSRRWLWLAILALLIVQGICFLALPLATDAGNRGMLPVSLRALEEADYSVDPMGTNQPQLQFAIVGDVLRDLEPEATDIDSRITALEESMQTPIAADAGAEATGTPTSTLDPSATSEPSSTATNGATGTASPAATSTPGPSPTPTASPTPGPSTTPTATLAASATQTPTSVATSTATVAPTQTPSTVPSATSVPTATSTPTLATVSCSMFSVSGFSVNGQQVVWDLNNASGTSVEISILFIAWPGSNDELVKIELSGDAIWDEEDEAPPTYVSGSWKSGVSRSVGASSTEPLLFQFGEEASPSSSNYNLRIDLDNGCRVTN